MSDTPASSPTPSTPSTPSTPPLRIAVTGASGLIGGHLVPALRADGHEVVRLVRRPARAADEARWDPSGGDPAVTADALRGCDAVVHLAGAGVADRRWTKRYKQTLRDSRVHGTAALAEALAQLADEGPRIWLCGSAVGYYGDTGDRAVDESDGPGTGFLAELCQEWEAAARPAQDAGVRTVFLRTGLVVTRSGGAWGRLFPVFRAGIGGRLGNGRQFWSHISLRDHLAALRFLLAEGPDGPDGPVNLTAPEPATNREVTRVMGRVLRRPTVFAVPAPVLRVVLGEFAEDVLGSQRVLPRRLLESGFVFADPAVEDSVRAALDSPKEPRATPTA